MAENRKRVAQLIITHGDIHTKHFKLPDTIGKSIKSIIAMASGLDSQDILLYVVNNSSSETIDIMLNEGVDVNESYDDNDQGKETALHCAVRLESYEKCKRLIRRNPNLTTTWRGMTPLAYGIAQGCSSDILELLAAEDKEVDNYLRLYGIAGESNLNAAVRLGVKSWITFLAKDANVLQADTTGLNALQLGCKDDELFTLLAQYTTNAKPDSNMKDWYEYVKTCSSKIYAKKGTENQLLPEQFDQILNRSRIISSGKCEEANDIRAQVLALVERVSMKLAARDKSKHLAFNSILAGSTAEGTKTFMPNEQDMVCEFTQECMEEGHKATINTKGEPCISTMDSPWKSLTQPVTSTVCSDKRLQSMLYNIEDRNEHDLNADNLQIKLDPQLVASVFYDEFQSALDEIIQEIEAGEIRFGNLHLFRKTVVLKDKISCMRLRWRGNVYKDMDVYVDLVPAFKVPNPLLIVEKERRLPMGNIYEEYHLIAKVSRRYKMPIPRFQVSHSRAELQLIKLLPEDIRMGLLVAKLMRLRSICSPCDVTDLQLEDDVSSEDFITSYMLKTTLFHLLQDMTTEAISEGTMFYWVDKIYEKLESFIRNGTIPLYHEGTIENIRFYPELLTCQHDDDVTRRKEHGCCLKRNVLLQLCTEIRKWLKNKSV